MTSILPVIICGGSGTRMWPLSRESLPKQFLSLIGARSSFQERLFMVASSPIFQPPLAISNVDYRFIVGEQMRQVGVSGQIVLEPERRDSGLAVAVAAEIAFRQDPATIVAVFAADHAIRDGAGFVSLCEKAAAAAAKGVIVTLGVTPDHAATGYGYIRPGKPIADTGAFQVAAFAEKPAADIARRYIADGYLWNSGCFIFRADVMRGEIEAFEPEMAQAAREAVDQAHFDLEFIVLDGASFAKGPKKSLSIAN